MNHPITFLRHLCSLFFKLFLIVRSPFMARGLLSGVAAGIEHLPLLRTISINSLIDIGANKGQFTLAALSIHRNARVIAFEPLTTAADSYEALFSAFKNVTCHRCAIGAARSEQLINRARAADSSSLLEITSLQTTLFPGTEKSGSESIQVKPLHEMVQPNDLLAPAFLKIDVQGFEMEVLKGAQPLLAHFEWIYIECSFVELYAKQALASEVILFLLSNGFNLAGIFNQTSRPPIVAVQADFLFRRKG